MRKALRLFPLFSVLLALPAAAGVRESYPEYMRLISNCVSLNAKESQQVCFPEDKTIPSCEIPYAMALLKSGFLVQGHSLEWADVITFANGLKKPRVLFNANFDPARRFRDGTVIIALPQPKEWCKDHKKFEKQLVGLTKLYSRFEKVRRGGLTLDHVLASRGQLMYQLDGPLQCPSASLILPNSEWEKMRKLRASPRKSSQEPLSCVYQDPPEPEEYLGLGKVCITRAKCTSGTSTNIVQTQCRANKDGSCPEANDCFNDATDFHKFEPDLTDATDCKATQAPTVFPKSIPCGTTCTYFGANCELHGRREPITSSCRAKSDGSCPSVEECRRSNEDIGRCETLWADIGDDPRNWESLKCNYLTSPKIIPTKALGPLCAADVNCTFLGNTGIWSKSGAHCLAKSDGTCPEALDCYKNVSAHFDEILLREKINDHHCVDQSFVMTDTQRCGKICQVSAQCTINGVSVERPASYPLYCRPLANGACPTADQCLTTGELSESSCNRPASEIIEDSYIQ